MLEFAGGLGLKMLTWEPPVYHNHRILKDRIYTRKRNHWKTVVGPAKGNRGSDAWAARGRMLVPGKDGLQPHLGDMDGKQTEHRTRKPLDPQ